jgi:hypothetical protein
VLRREMRTGPCSARRTSASPGCRSSIGRAAAIRISRRGGRPDESTAELAIRYCESGPLGTFLERLRITDLRGGTVAEADVSTPTALPHAVTAGPSTIAVEWAGTHIITTVTTTDLPAAADGGSLDGLVRIFIGPGEANQVAFTLSDTIPAPFGSAIVFPGGALDFSDPGLRIQEFQFDLTGIVDVANGEAVLIENTFAFQVHEEPVTLADEVLLDVDLLLE